MLNIFAFSLYLLHADPRSADMTFIKGDAPVIRLRMTADGRARITRGRHVLIEGRLRGEDSSYRIETPEGEICPPVTIELVHEVERPREVGAEVAIDLTGVDGQARQACAGLEEVGGSYARVQ